MLTSSPNTPSFSQLSFQTVHWKKLILAIALLPFIFATSSHARASFSILTGPEKPIVGQPCSIFLNWRNPDAAARVTILVLEPESRNWNVLTHNADRAGTIPRVSWTPRRTGTHTVRVDIAVPEQREVRKTIKVKVVEDQVSLQIQGGVPALGSRVWLTPEFTSDSANRHISFAVKYDASNRWQPINGRRDGDRILWFPAAAGSAELRVQASGRSGVIEGFCRVLVRTKPQPVRMTGKAPAWAPGAAGEFPELEHLITMDKKRGRVGEERTLNIHMHAEPRANRRISIRYRNVARDRDWIVYQQNIDRLILPWTPRFTGEYLIEAQIYQKNGAPGRREEVRFIAIP